ncbi:MAG: EAL domain-containing protein [Campylobacterota bacterium]|nr:EAL domain-containing protein [Campylobacterota bacterium]
MFFIIAFVRIYINYNDNKKNVEEFIFEQSKLIDSLYITHRDYYQDLYLNGTIKLDEDTVVGLPAYAASKISKTFSKNNDLHISMQTVSDRARNLDNQADNYELKAIDHFKNNLNSKEYFSKESGFYQYATPLKIEKKCLTCHGKKEDAPKFISEKYNDAYNYKIGEVRGILSVKVPTDYVDKIFSKQLYTSIVYDFLLFSIVTIIAIYLMRFFSNFQAKLEDELDGKTSELQKSLSILTKQKEELLLLATTDLLTKLGNRDALVNEIKQNIDQSIIVINIDAFSHVNDFYGHKIGDELLIQFAKKLQKICAVEKEFKLFRVSGDEFAILAIDVVSHSVVIKAQEIIKNTDLHIYEIGNEKIEINTTIGISFENKERLIITADMALKIARKESKELVIYDEEISLDREYSNNMLWTKKIKEAIKNDNIVVFFQPIVDNVDESINRYESLVRLIDSNGKVISPFFFLDIAKKAKLYKQLTKIVIQKSFEAFRENSLEFSINLSIDDILDKEINSYILEMLDIYNISDRVIFEIVESESIENFEDIQSFIKSVKSLGCRIAIDDFGTGYSNFEYLMRLEPDFIKIDGSIIKEILNDEKSEIITTVIVDFAKKMDIQVIAEFVEDRELFMKIKELGIEKSQGYYFGEPKATLI